jgi:hypothetical protein
MFTDDELTTLVTATPAPGLSFYLPTQTFGRETRQNPIMLKNLLAQVRRDLAARDLPDARIEALLGPATDLLDDYDFWQHQEEGLALFLSDDGMQAFKLPVAVEEQVIVGDAFHILPLLALRDDGAEYIVLAMTADGNRTFRATRFRMTAFDVADMPDSVEALDELPDYEGPLQSHGYGRPYSGGKSMPKTQVYGDSPEEWRKGRLVEYTRRTALALAAHLAARPADVVVIADAALGGHLASAEALQGHIVGQVEANPDTMDEAGLHDAAATVMQGIRDKDDAAAYDRLDAVAGREDKTLCTDPVALSEATETGMVDLLFLPTAAARAVQTTDPTWTNDSAASSPMMPDPAMPDAATRDKFNEWARLTLQNGGTVRIAPRDRLPKGALAAAILRY